MIKLKMQIEQTTKDAAGTDNISIVDKRKVDKI